MKLEKEKIEELKKEHPNGIYEGSISFNDEKDALHEQSFIYRKPTTEDLEAHAKVAQRNPLVANLNLIQSIIVYPEPGPVIDAIRDYPAAYGQFVDKAISPFFGDNVTVKTKKL